MASYENLLAMEQTPWQFRPTFPESLFCDILIKETETLTKALQNSSTPTNSFEENFNNINGNSFSANNIIDSLLLNTDNTTPLHTPTGSVSGSAGSEYEAPVQRRRGGNGPTGRITKRKARASKRATTTFITADPANFREMVQQVTGVGFSGQFPAPVMKPEVQRGMGFMMPTLDASSFLLDPMGPSSGFAAPTQVVAPTAVAGGGGGFEYDAFCSFPTLESSRLI